MKKYPSFTSEDETENIIEGYFSSLKGPPTVSGLAFILGFDSRKAIQNYPVSRPCGLIVRRALLRVEDFAEGKLLDKNSFTGAKFFLEKNFKGWCEEIENSPKSTNNLLDVLKEGLDAVAQPEPKTS